MMNSNEETGMTLNMPVAWDMFGQFLVYAIMLGMVIAVGILMYKLFNPTDDLEETENSEEKKQKD